MSCCCSVCLEERREGGGEGNGLGAIAGSGIASGE